MPLYYPFPPSVGPGRASLRHHKGVLALIAASLMLQSPDQVGAWTAQVRRAGGAMGDRVVAAARLFEGKPYLAKTLEVSDTQEQCVVRLDGFDCVTLVESAIGIARLSYRSGNPSASDLRNEITRLRYRGGKVDGYLSRLHYTSDWLQDNSQRGLIADMSAALPGAKSLKLNLGYMSSHPSQYRQLKANPSLVPGIRQIEDTMNKRTWHYIPKAAFSQAEPSIQAGDIIAFTTSQAGLDTAHLGLAWRDEKKGLRLLHASTLAKQVTLDGTIRDYLARQRSITGVMVGRPAAPDASLR